MRPLNSIALTSGASATNQNGTQIDANQLFACSLQVVTTGSAAGTAKLQISNDQPPDGNMESFTVTNWVDLAGATVAVSAATSYLIPRKDISYQWIRAVWTFTGTGVQTVTTIADVAGALNNKYFFINDSVTDGATQYYVWINVDGGGTDPLVAGLTGIEVDIASGDSAATIATAVASAITSDSNITAGAVGAVVTCTNNSAGGFIPASDHNSGFAFAVTTGSGNIVSHLKALGV